jgi:phosphoglucosamine mutase
MDRKYFGTDGVRGRANEALTPDFAMRLGQAAGAVFRRGEHRNRVIIGKDTRLSGYMIETALVAGFTSVGMDVLLLGPLPTPAVAMLTRAMRADLGVMISASHNPFQDNGIKLFGPDGYKLSDEEECAIEALIDGEAPRLAGSADLGRATRIDSVNARYVEFAKNSLSRDISLDGMRVVLDCANGAGYRVAPEAFWELGAEVITIGDKPDGFNINREVGSTAPRALSRKVLELRADLGVALDGDADRLIVVDEKGRVVDGDQIMALIATKWAQEGRLSRPGVVATIMSNLGLERYLLGVGLSLERTAVGDRHVLHHMRTHGYNFGGEQSGHLIMSDLTTTGDGLIAALQVAAAVAVSGEPASKVCHLFDPLPQVSRNVRLAAGQRPGARALKELHNAGAGRLGSRGRIIVRPSGTEPLVRVMAEGEDRDFIGAVVDEVCAAVAELTKCGEAVSASPADIPANTPARAA